MAAFRTMAEPNKGRLRGTGARARFDAVMSGIAPQGVTFREDVRSETGLAVGSTVTTFPANRHFTPAECAGLLLNAEGEPQ